jgi:hypothetical protein
MTHIMSDSYYSKLTQMPNLSDSFQYNPASLSKFTSGLNESSANSIVLDSINKRLATEDTIIEILKSNFHSFIYYYHLLKKKTKNKNISSK